MSQNMAGQFSTYHLAWPSAAPALKDEIKEYPAGFSSVLEKNILNGFKPFNFPLNILLQST
jgi:hypothetical protein